MRLGEFKKWLAVCGFQQNGASMSGGGIAGVKPIGLLAQSGAAVVLTGTTSKTQQASLTIPAGAVGPNGSLRITPLWSATNNANNKTGFIDIGGNTLWAPILSTQGGAQGQIILRNTGVTNAQQVFSGGSGIGTGVPTSLALDMTVAQTLRFYGQLAVGTDTITLLGYTVEVLNP